MSKSNSNSQLLLHRPRVSIQEILVISKSPQLKPHLNPFPGTIKTTLTKSLLHLLQQLHKNWRRSSSCREDRSSKLWVLGMLAGQTNNSSHCLTSFINTIRWCPRHHLIHHSIIQVVMAVRQIHSWSSIKIQRRPLLIRASSSWHLTKTWTITKKMLKMIRQMSIRKLNC